jgi:predicted ATP-grasp superfamily ATP-dependent carboligase
VEIKKNNPVAVVIGLSINALSIIRSLGRRSIDVLAINSNKSGYAAKSKYCKIICCENLFGELMIEKLREIGWSLTQKGVLFCTSDSSVLTVSKHERELQEFYHFVLPAKETIDMLISKIHFHNFAIENGFDVPQTKFIIKKEDITKIGETITYPCIIKPEYRDIYWDTYVSKVNKIFFAQSKDAYYKLFRSFNLSNKPLIVQEWIDGSDEDVFYCLTYINRNNEPLAVFTGKKIRQFPVLTGSTAFAESKWEPHVAHESLRLLKAAGCIGICSVEFKRSQRDNCLKITEPTVGRTDTQEGSSISSGMDIPYLAYMDALGKDPEPIKHFNEGIKWINEPEDYNSIRSYMKNQSISWKELISSYKGKRTYALRAWDDPLPFLSFVGNKLGNGIFRVFNNGSYSVI